MCVPPWVTLSVYARGEPSELNKTRSARQVTLNPVAFAAGTTLATSGKDPYESFAGEMA